jgi:xylulokinase
MTAASYLLKQTYPRPAKALLVDPQAIVKVLPRRFHFAYPLWSEQDHLDGGLHGSEHPRRWKASVSKDAISAIGLTGQMHGLVLLDEAVMCPAILWNDQRTGPQCDDIRRGWFEKLVQI